jgi:voltage-gated potassium channel
VSRWRRSLERFRANPASIRHATVAIISVTVAVVTVGAVLVRIFDHKEYPTIWRALWFTLQTVTTVGYGDATPENTVGRIVAAIVMVTAIGLISVVTASITSLFVEAARAQGARSDQIDDDAARARIESSLRAIQEQLDRLESTLAATREDPDASDDVAR